MVQSLITVGVLAKILIFGRVLGGLPALIVDGLCKGLCKVQGI